jgi:hypothetical protein
MNKELANSIWKATSLVSSSKPVQKIGDSLIGVSVFTAFNKAVEGIGNFFKKKDVKAEEFEA